MLVLYLSLIESDNEKGKFEEIYIKYRSLMLSRAYEILKDKELSEDAVHNAFIRVLKNLHKLEKADSVKTKAYVMITLENAAKTMYVKQRKSKIYELDENIPDDTDVEQRAETKITAEKVAEKIAELPEIYRDILVLKFLNGLEDKEIAAALGISAATVRKRLQRAREKLRKLIGGQYG